MAVKIRLTRLGDKKSPFYRVVVADSRVARDGKVIDNLGTYNPLKNPAEIVINKQKAAEWIKNGAEPTETARTVLVKAGVILKKDAKPFAPKSVTKARKDTKAE
ncbi:MAG: 30S ribosomal protein S16 [Christensenellaceae bacterium]|jgi:small subunit ribosomal protein S16|nr:30S ribosomal protein S16 [Christensenellaceae bacterium]